MPANRKIDGKGLQDQSPILVLQTAFAFIQQPTEMINLRGTVLQAIDWKPEHLVPSVLLLSEQFVQSHFEPCGQPAFRLPLHELSTHKFYSLP